MSSGRNPHDGESLSLPRGAVGISSSARSGSGKSAELRLRRGFRVCGAAVLAQPVSTTAAVVVASCVVSRELVAIAYVRKRFMAVSWRASLLQVTGGGARVTAVGFLIGNA
jgi:hypothetical protein